jgi:hypothetical protein
MALEPKQKVQSTSPKEGRKVMEVLQQSLFGCSVESGEGELPTFRKKQWTCTSTPGGVTGTRFTVPPDVVKKKKKKTDHRK